MTVEYETTVVDPLYAEAKRLVVESRHASIAFVQRKMLIGYNRAARFVEAMEHEGIVSAPDYKGARTVNDPCPDCNHPSRGVVDEELQARELLAAEYERAGFAGAADDARSNEPSPHCAVTLRAIRAALQAAALPAVPEVKEAAFGDQPMSLRERIWTMELEAGSLRAVATKTGVDVGYLSRLKSGEKINPRDDTLSKLGLVRRVGYALAAAPAQEAQ